ncbi:imelysin family protein [Vibrio rumoiensis]|uniref:Iron-regulated protein A n=1 Tax=Vibrio rumoiensis 1S-45 TaxID=1188252 RepID=A0A1E5E5K5_9VIBR|nr:imelysin family protein [Vibrio rumoiensis]OEF29191.1 iron-regulated protein A [Vibrio rumoiensis 1S-45]
MFKTLAVVVSVSLLSGVIYYTTSSYSTAENLSEPSNSQQQVHQIEEHFAQQFSSTVSNLQTSVSQYCSPEANMTLSDVQAKWLDSMHAWMSLQGQAKGPQEAVSLGWNIQFWPDKKNITGRKMEQLLQDNTLWNASSIAEQSVTVQGLSGLEWLLFDTNSEFSKGNKSACTLVNAVSDNLKNNAETIEQQWKVNPWASYDQDQWQAEYLGLLMNQLDFVLQKMSRPLAKIGHPRPYFSEAWRSKQSLALIKSNVAALRELYLANGKGLDALLRLKGNVDLADRLAAQFDQTLSTWPKESSLFDMLQTKDGYREALAQYNKLERIKYLLHDEAAVELGVVVGFNSTDGD